MIKIFKSIADCIPGIKPFYYGLKAFPLSIRRLFLPVNWYNLRQTRPVSDFYGLDRGHSTDRYYIERFLRRNRSCISGTVLEIGDDLYTQKFGIAVRCSDILDIQPANIYATVISDLRTGKGIPSNKYDCIILTQVLQYIDDLGAAVKQLHRILRPGGVALVTLPAVSRIDVAAGITGDYWRFTAASAEYLFSQYFTKRNLHIETFGNVLSGTAFWQGIAWEELKPSELNFNDPNFPVVIAVTARK